MKKTLALLFVLVIFALPLCACGADKSGDDTTPVVTGAPVTEVTTTVAPETTAYPKLPENANYEGYEYVMLMSGLSSDGFNDFADDNENGFETVNEAIFRRNEAVGDALNCKITNVEDLGASWGNGPGFKRVVSDYMAGEASYDICAVGTFDAPQLAVGGYLLDMNNIPYIDLAQSWWDQQANADLCIAGKMYYTTGDISIADNLATHCILFNKDVAKDLQITDIYSLVADYKWTFDKMSEYIRMGSADLDGVEGMTAADRYGILCWNDMLQASVSGIKSKICGVDADGLIELTMYSERNEEFVGRLTTLLFDNDYAFNYVNRITTGSWKTEMPKMFADGHGFFLSTMFSTVPQLRDTDTDFGIVPYPMYDENQGEYGGYIGATYAVMYCMEQMIDDEECSGAISELLAYESQKIVTPVYYEKTLKGRDVRDDESIRSLEIIFASRTFDLGIYYLIGDYTGQLTNMMKASTNRFTTIYESYKKVAEVKIGNLNKQFSEIEDK